MTEVIAVRTFSWLGQPDARVTVTIGKPTQAADSLGEFYCPIQIVGLGNDEHTQAIYGVDGFQAIELAMRYVGYSVSDINAKSGGRLRWLGEPIPAKWALQPE